MPHRKAGGDIMSSDADEVSRKLKGKGSEKKNTQRSEQAEAQQEAYTKVRQFARDLGRSTADVARQVASSTPAKWVQLYGANLNRPVTTDQIKAFLANSWVVWAGLSFYTVWLGKCHIFSR